MKTYLKAVDDPKVSTIDMLKQKLDTVPARISLTHDFGTNEGREFLAMVQQARGVMTLTEIEKALNVGRLSRALKARR